MDPLCVDLWVVIAGGNVSNNRIQRDIEAANEVWKTCRIHFSLKGILTIRSVNVEKFVGNGVFTSSNPPEILNMLSIRPLYPGRYKIVIYYVDGKRFSDGANGVSPYPLPLTEGGPRPSIILTNDAHPDVTFTRFVLAHELGHTLFLNPNNLTLTNPSTTATPDGFHDNDPNNLMFVGGVGSNPTINKEQCEKARLSVFARRCWVIPIPIHIFPPFGPVPPWPPPGPPPPGPPMMLHMFYGVENPCFGSSMTWNQQYWNKLG
ncbi:hypothetical protein R4Z09_24825 [Niallia oryzisoli]|uniref:Peptidase M10 metallopeptidase domain-containing protein n=1 Tax=Niallia oryzisoli TaxID=1737571 RepID=A0ABZ2CBL6_9BACI